MRFRSRIDSAALALALTLAVNTVMADVVAVVSSTSAITTLSSPSDGYLPRQDQPLSQRRSRRTHRPG